MICLSRCHIEIEKTAKTVTLDFLKLYTLLISNVFLECRAFFIDFHLSGHVLEPFNNI